MRKVTYQIKITSGQAGVPVVGDGARLTGLLRDHTAAKPKVKRPAVIICPGGAYERLSDREAQPVAFHFLADGSQAFVLEYSVAPNRFPVALLELASAVALVRDHADQWDINRDKIVVCGFSAGGHLAGCLGVFWNKGFLHKALGVSKEQIKPDALLLSYPVVTLGEYGHQVSARRLLGEDAESEEMRRFLSLECQADSQVPPVFLWHTCEDQSVPVENSLLLASALRRAGVSLELHIYPAGRHGLALADEETDKTGEEGFVVPGCQSWIKLALLWMKYLWQDDASSAKHGGPA